MTTTTFAALPIGGTFATEITESHRLGMRLVALEIFEKTGPEEARLVRVVDVSPSRHERCGPGTAARFPAAINWPVSLIA